MRKKIKRKKERKIKSKKIKNKFNINKLFLYISLNLFHLISSPLYEN